MSQKENQDKSKDEPVVEELKEENVTTIDNTDKREITNGDSERLLVDDEIETTLTKENGELSESETNVNKTDDVKNNDEVPFKKDPSNEKEYMEPLILLPDEVLSEKEEQKDQESIDNGLTESNFLSSLKEGQLDKVISPRRSIRRRVDIEPSRSFRDSFGRINISYFSSPRSIKRKNSDAPEDDCNKKFKSNFMSTIMSPFKTRLGGNSTPELTSYFDRQIGEISNGDMDNNEAPKKWCVIM